jgi:hypothetical protein
MLIPLAAGTNTSLQLVYYKVSKKHFMQMQGVS